MRERVKKKPTTKNWESLRLMEKYFSTFVWCKFFYNLILCSLLWIHTHKKLFSFIPVRFSFSTSAANGFCFCRCWHCLILLFVGTQTRWFCMFFPIHCTTIFCKLSRFLYRIPFHTFQFTVSVYAYGYCFGFCMFVSDRPTDRWGIFFCYPNFSALSSLDMIRVHTILLVNAME